MGAFRVLGGTALIAFALTSCASAAPALPAPSTTTATPSSNSTQVTASVQVVPAEMADLAFVIAGPVKEVAAHEGDQVRAGDPLVTLDAPQLAGEDAAAQAAVNSAKADAFIQSQGRRKWDGFKFVWVSGPPEQLQEANARVDQAEAALTIAQSQLAQATLLAPFDGTVVAIEASVGETVQPNEVVATIGSLNQLRVETTDLSERNIEGVRIGDAATVRLKAFGTPLTGHVSAIAPLAGKSSDGDTVFKVTIQLDQQPQGLMWGMTGEADIALR